MDVERFMTAEPIAASPSTSLRKALELLEGHRIRHLPVVQGKRLVGIISDRDIRQMLPSSLSVPEELERFRTWGARVKVGEVMTRQVVSVTPDTRVQRAARLMVERRIGCLPVLRGSALVGIVTTVDLLRAMAGEDQTPTVARGKGPASRRKSLEDRRTPRPEGKVARRS
jgi:acetoin utilization protein AcuB